MPITNPTEKYFQGGGWGYDGSQWRALAMLWGYSDTYVEREAEVDADVGTNTFNFSTVPAGEVWVVTNFAFRNQDNVCSAIVMQLYDGSTGYVIRYQGGPTGGVWDTYDVNVILKAGYNLRCIFYGCTADDYIEASAVGYKMTTDEG